MTVAIQNVDSYVESFAAFERLAAGRELPWLRKMREDAFARFCDVGFPTTHDEDWRFTNVSVIARTRFSAAPRTFDHLSDADLRPWRMEGAAAQLVFVDGRFVRKLSSLEMLPASVTISSVGQGLAEGSEVLATHFGRYLDVRRDPFCALNTAFAEDGAFVRVGRGVALEEPIHVLFVSTKSENPTMVHPRNLIIFEPESQATVVEEYVSLGDGMVLCNSATELIAGESSTASHYMIVCEDRETSNISTLRIQQDRSSNVATHSLLLGGGLVRNNVHPVLAGEGGECLINGLFVGDARQHLDNYMYVEHASPHCSSRQFYNGILDGNAHGVFHGRIVVHKDAQKTDAKQTNRNLLLSDDAQIDSKPQLEIYADDVKCTHGATIGQIEDNALFYLQSRGIDRVSARRLLLLAFAGECLERMTPGRARTRAERLIHERLVSVAHDLRGELNMDRNRGERSCEEVG